VIGGLAHSAGPEFDETGPSLGDPSLNPIQFRHGDAQLPQKAEQGLPEVFGRSPANKLLKQRTHSADLEVFVQG
jgi:hypothetical protein